mmetsp:Transcript_31171/g.51961  ORF Transcript_31171/g.51961 Transcript_31171/m.51961 type:complete len:284 (+) Transcript_31171:3794-4645(+)
MNFSSEINAQCHTDVMRHDQISKSLGALKLVVLQPLLHQRKTLLLQNRLGDFDTLLFVKTAAFQQCREILQDRRNLVGLRRNLLESGNSGRCSQGISRGSNNLSGLCNLSGTDEAFEFGSEQVFSSWQIQSTRHFQSQVGISQCLNDVGDDRGMIELETQHLSRADGNTKHGTSRILRTRHKDSFIGDLGAVKALSSVKVEHENIAHLGNEIRNVILSRNAQCDREVVCGVCRDRDSDRLNTKGLSLAGVTSDFANEQFRRFLWVLCLLFVKDEQLRRVVTPR